MRLVSLLLISIATLYANVVGNLSGNLSVNNGALNYNVPLKLPKGVAGYTPQISLNYNSNGANGYYGQGWSLTGLSAISRCGSNLALDGVKKGVKYTTEDNICLDGQRLVAVSGNNWDEGSEYRTKIESYSKIIYNSNNTFTVYTKVGEIKEYSLINQTWYLSSSKDRYNNTITYNYTSTSNEVYLDNISYGDNTIKLNYEDRLDKTNVYSGGYNIQINKRVDSIDIKNGSTILRNYDLSYKAQSSVSDKSLIESIKECSSGSCLESLKFTYNEIGDQFGEFQDWGKNNPPSAPEQTYPTWNVNEYALSKHLDINGDGLVDKIHHHNYSTNIDSYWVQLNMGSEFGPLEDWGRNNPPTRDKQSIPIWKENGYELSKYIDLNGDGLLDRVHNNNYSTNEGGYWVQLNTGSEFGPYENWGRNNPPSWSDQAIPVWKENGYILSEYLDLNGDGLLDRVHHHNYSTNIDSYWVQLNMGNEFGPLEDWGRNNPPTRDKQSIPIWKENGYELSKYIDLNGDGLLDRVHNNNYSTNEGGYWVQLNTGSEFGPYENWGRNNPPSWSDQAIPVWKENESILSEYLDVNGDGLQDRVHHKNYATNEIGYWVQLNTGSEFGPFENWGKNNPPSKEEQTYPTWNSGGITLSMYLDVNGDGLPDRVHQRNYTTNEAGYWVQLNTGSEFGPYENWGIDNFPSTAEQTYPTWNSGGITLSMYLDVNGDGLQDRVHQRNYTVNEAGYWVQLNKSNNKNHLISITDSFGNETNINYKHLTEDGIYTKYSDSIYPNRDIQGSTQVISSVVSKTPTGEDSTTNYTYEGLKTNIHGLGSLGFAKITSENSLNNVKIVMEYNQNYPLVGTVNKTTTTMNDVLLSETTNTYTSTEIDGISKIYLDQSIVKNHQDGLHLTTTTNVNNTFDNYGNILNSSSSIKDETTNEEFITNSVNTYTNNESNWLLGKLTNTLVTSSAYGDAKTKETSFTYDITTGGLLSKTSEPNKDKKLTKTYTYNSNGTLNTEKISGSDILNATTTYTYEYSGDTLIKSTITNALGHAILKTYDNKGQVTYIKDANDVFTNFTYDNFGKKLSESKLGVTTTYTYAYNNSISGSLYKVIIQKNGAAPKTTYYNSLAMPLQSETIGFDGRKIISSQKYDTYGNVIEKIKPHFDGDESQSIYYTYDAYKRLKSTDSPGDNGRVVNSISYNGFTTTATNSKNQSKITTKNALGKVVKIQEPLGATIDYKYDALGNLIETKDANGITISLGYDIYGNKISQNDPDMGNWTYTYNALGKLVSQTDAKGQTTNYTYDKLGRKVVETIVGDSNSTWEYDITKAGKLYKEEKKDASGNIVVKKVYSYNNLVKVSSVYTNIDNESYTRTYNYDTLGRVVEKTMPNGFMILNEYDDNGYLLSIKSPKTEIADFNRSHFFTLIEDTLDHSEDLYKKSIEYDLNATDYYTKIDDYRYIANLSSTSASDAQTLNDIADQLEANANALKFEAEYSKKQSDSHRATVDGYISEAMNSNSINGIDQYEEFYNQLNSIYTTYSTNILSIASQYANHSAYESNTNEQIEVYLSISTEALKTASNASQMANNFENLANNYSSSQDELVAYQDTLSDNNFNYFYKVLKYNAYNQVVSYMSGNGLITNTSFNDSGAISNITTGYNYNDDIRNLEFTYDSLGNLATRKDKELFVEQTYTYDDLNRIIEVGILTLSDSDDLYYTYDLSGNLLSKTGIGSYTYKPNTHQVISIGSRDLTYDLNGNVLTNGTASFTYTPFNKPKNIATSDRNVSFSYDMNKKRHKKIDVNSSSTTYYVDKVYENTLSGSTEEHKYLIYVNGKVIAIYKTIGSTANTKYLHYDSLNSVDTITNNLGMVEAKMAYKPFGKKLNLDSNGIAVSVAPFTNRGYTGHEHIEDTSFIHMNARVYDSEIGRFMSADTLIPYMYNSQSYNRYSYVRNNPLKYIDPTGHWGGSFKRAFKRAVEKTIEPYEKAFNEVKETVREKREELKMAVIVAAAVSSGGFAAGLAGGGFLGALAGGAVSGMVTGYGVDLAYNLEGSRWAMMRDGALRGMENSAKSYINPDAISFYKSIKDGSLEDSIKSAGKAYLNKEYNLDEYSKYKPLADLVTGKTKLQDLDYGEYQPYANLFNGDKSKENVLAIAGVDYKNNHLYKNYMSFKGELNSAENEVNSWKSDLDSWNNNLEGYLDDSLKDYIFNN